MGQLLKIITICFLSLNAVAQEGVSTTIDSARLNEVKEWVENAKYTLDTNLENIQRSSIADQEARYEDVIETILRQSGEKPNEFLMRNILHRAKVVYANLKQVPSSPKRDALARRLLEDALTWAKSLYEPDLNLMKLAREGKLTEALRGAEFAKLGIEWADYMLSLYYLAPQNSIKLQLMKDLMGIMYNDINNDDAVKRLLAPISGAVVIKHRDMNNLNIDRPLDKLVAARDLRRFVEQQIRIAKETLKMPVVEQVAVSSEVSGAQPEIRSRNGSNRRWTFKIDETVLRNNSTVEYTIAGIMNDGKYKLKYVRGYNWMIDPGIYAATDLAKRTEVNAKFSIGEAVIVGSNNYTIAGITHDGRYRLRFVRGYNYVIHENLFAESQLARTK